ncbi:glycine betaine/L-proline ABC transporter ATP-binding protein ProV [Marinobacterium sedimentorum]|uniref:glycine betaine/L-proline ABC transporter ATP-binding protein ProV n=1 Tax=Marinobacterium sedimentorum TaxID=2927804 RepID=UPI0020C691F1|nr:glycine betaine/L-proline ABC transporter ATP-binding protein ProV [Marinobacterium sedimentorum]MCP8687619.1 glycine betaine/L-proline ABC transporter ATP-binding protein ProV [Marinobacterium sedimentorum]
MTNTDEILSIKNVYKVFGAEPDTAMKMLEKGADKNEIFEKTGQVIGVFDASFSVRKGEIFVIMGLSGSGKSTLVRLLNRLIEPTAGSIALNGRDITRLGDKDLLDVRRKDMSMVFQSFALMPHMSVLENAAFGLEISGVAEAERHARAQEALSQVGLGEHGASFPHQLSGGMQQRVGLARALTNDPTILLMDEAFSALDPLIRYEMQGELIRLQKEQERTIIFISHDLDEAIRIGDRIAIMEGGRIVQIGTPQDILSNPADDYVETFFKGVDISRILKAGDIAHKDPRSLIKLNGSVSLLDASADIQFRYLVDDQEQLQGIVTGGDFAGQAPDMAALNALKVAQPLSIRSDAPLHEVMTLVADTAYPLPVLDSQGAFLGTISKSLLLQTLSHQ